MSTHRMSRRSTPRRSVPRILETRRIPAIRRILLSVLTCAGVATLFLGSAPAAAEDPPLNTAPPGQATTTVQPAQPSDPTTPAPSTPADDETSVPSTPPTSDTPPPGSTSASTTPPTTTTPPTSTTPGVETGTVTVTAVLTGAHDTINGVAISINGVIASTPSTMTVPAGPVVVKFLGGPEGTELVGAQQVELEVAAGENAVHTFVLTPIGYTADRDPEHRVDLQSVPSGPTHR